MSEIIVVATAKAKPGFEAALEKEFKAVVPPTHEEPGCLRYAFHKSISSPGSYAMIERWSSKEALDKHLAAPHVQTLFRNIEKLLEAPAQLAIYEALPMGRKEKYL